MIADLFDKYGKRVGQQKNIPLTAEREKILMELKRHPPEKLGDREVLDSLFTDGVKFNFSQDDWLLLRPSGTEPLVRCYAESGSQKEVDVLMQKGLDLLG
jgi:phosphoglucomutase